MQHPQPATFDFYSHSEEMESPACAVSWGAIIAGAVIAAAVSAMLITGGAGLGLLSVSPWHQEEISGISLTIGSIVWMLATQIIAYSLGGYIAGRLRTKWTDAQFDEIYFRDTAHGFLVWALSALAGLIVFGAMAASIASKTGAVLTDTSASPTGAHPTTQADYYTDVLLRSAEPTTARARDGAHAEVSRLLAHSLENGRVSDSDRPYLATLIAHHAKLDEANAEQRLRLVEDLSLEAGQQMRETADAARKAAAAFSLWAFASLLMGAFVASFAATVGGRARDRGTDTDMDDERPLEPLDPTV